MHSVQSQKVGLSGEAFYKVELDQESMEHVVDFVPALKIVLAERPKTANEQQLDYTNGFEVKMIVPENKVKGACAAVLAAAQGAAQQHFVFYPANNPRSRALELTFEARVELSVHLSVHCTATAARVMFPALTERKESEQ